ncbi:hypothetical protein EX30DRAFT_32090 [Ascodesmis nigricans]|uniref:Zf-MIZ-domain-containing protein n=1 Tax=Ascodesmis nigricans TaxID=341454 RepID=A0A4S2MWE0_9PEZI|nr:hypothetical protein EX30DRAFT_32090 [Ascodesmis nigricans]
MATSQAELNRVINYMHTRLIVRQLAAVLRRHGLVTSGLKGVLQKRLKDYIHEVFNSGNTARFEALKNDIFNPDGLSGGPTMNVLATSSVLPPMGTFVNSYTSSSTATSSSSQLPANIHFVESPFYTVLTQLSNVVLLPTMTQNRHNVKAVVTLAEEQAAGLRDGKYKAMVYCTMLDGRPFASRSEIAFPHQSELSVNSKTVTGVNLRGLKNKPGTTRPADITSFLVLKSQYRNEVTLTYAVTREVRVKADFGFQVNLVSPSSVDVLVGKLKTGDAISKRTVIDDLAKKNQDPDIVATSQIMSLKCPISTLRIETPVRSRHCRHMQCFDATSFLQLQQQAPTWNCPTCNHTVLFKQLAVDEYFGDILSNTPKTVDSVTIDPDGQWAVAAESSNSPAPDDSDDEYTGKDIVSLDDDSPQPPRRTTSVTTPAVSTPSSTRAGGSTTTKRAASQVIDLTLSSDDDEPPPTRIKRMHNVDFPTPPSYAGATAGFYGSSGRSTPASGGQFSPVGTPDSFTSTLKLPPLQRPNYIPNWRNGR